METATTYQQKCLDSIEKHYVHQRYEDGDDLILYQLRHKVNTNTDNQPTQLSSPLQQTKQSSTNRQVPSTTSRRNGNRWKKSQKDTPRRTVHRPGTDPNVTTTRSWYKYRCGGNGKQQPDWSKLAYFLSRSERDVILQPVLARFTSIKSSLFGLIYCTQNSVTYCVLPILFAPMTAGWGVYMLGQKLRLKAHHGSAETCLVAWTLDLASSPLITGFCYSWHVRRPQGWLTQTLQTIDDVQTRV